MAGHEGDAIDVSPAGLQTFAGTVDADTEDSFRPAAQRLFAVYGQGPSFGATSGSLNVQAARAKHFAAMEATTRSMATYVNVSKVLIAAVRQVADAYANADDRSRALLDPAAVFNGALAEATRLQAEAERAEQADRRQRGLA